MMRTGSIPARRRFELIRLAQQTRFDGISICSQWAVLSGEPMEERSRRIILSRAGLVRPTERFANCREDARRAMRV
jgi:hypothetical protein